MRLRKTNLSTRLFNIRIRLKHQKKYLIDELASKPRISFTELIESYPTRIGVIFNFLAILEMLALQLLTIQIGEGFGNFWIAKPEATEAIL